jgi:hypothetical protein
MIVVASMWTAGLQLFAPLSLAYRAAGSSTVIDVVNVAVLVLSGLALADIAWHDILRRGLILPSFPMRWRHQFCVATYSALAAAFGIRAFVATGDPAAVVQVGLYYVLVAAGITIEAAALAHEQREEREPSCRNDCGSA